MCATLLSNATTTTQRQPPSFGARRNKTSGWHLQQIFEAAATAARRHSDCRRCDESRSVVARHSRRAEGDSGAEDAAVALAELQQNRHARPRNQAARHADEARADGQLPEDAARRNRHALRAA